MAQRALRTLSQPEIYDLEEIREALTVTDKEGRRSDWKRIQKIARWLQYSGHQDETIREHLPEVIVALETVLSSHHEIDYAREAVALALGELGNSQTFALLIRLLEKKDELYLEAASAMLSSLRNLASRSQVGALFEKKSTESFKAIREAYPQLERKVRDVEDQVHQYFERRASPDEK